MCEEQRKGQVGEKGDERSRSESPPVEQLEEKAAIPEEAGNLAGSWGERIGYGF
jgi:hypothetical protein